MAETNFPMVEGTRMVGQRLRGENAGLHQDSKFLNGVKGYSEQKGWHWEPQPGPDAPYEKGKKKISAPGI
jgi:hypothetical protein